MFSRALCLWMTSSSLALCSACGVDADPPAMPSAVGELPAPSPTCDARMVALSTRTTSTAPSAGDVLADLDLQLMATTQSADAQPSNWMRRANVAALQQRMARLDGDLFRYEASLSALDEAYDVAPDGAGPHATSASVHGSLHHNPEAADAIERALLHPLLDNLQRASLLTQRSTLRWQGDDVDGAWDDIEQALSLHPSSSTLAIAAGMHSDIGDVDTARILLDDALRQPMPSTGLERAFFLFRRGLVELKVGANHAAMAWMTAADAAMPDWYLVREHQAELLLRGHCSEEALALYRDVVELTPSPEYADAIADVLEELGHDDEVDGWRATALDELERRLARFPRAMSSHGVDQLGARDPQRALQLARDDVERRPGAAQRVTLMAALLTVGTDDAVREALTIADDLDAAGWSAPAFVDVQLELANVTADDDEKERLHQTLQQWQEGAALPPDFVDPEDADHAEHDHDDDDGHNH